MKPGSVSRASYHDNVKVDRSAPRSERGQMQGRNVERHAVYMGKKEAQQSAPTAPQQRVAELAAVLMLGQQLQ